MRRVTGWSVIGLILAILRPRKVALAKSRMMRYKPRTVPQEFTD
jgi:hypothetical protein